MCYSGTCIHENRSGVCDLTYCPFDEEFEDFLDEDDFEDDFDEDAAEEAAFRKYGPNF
jgi:hypothetical protein